MRVLREFKLAAAAALPLIIAAAPALATTKDQAFSMCRARGDQCKSFGIGGQDNPGGDVVLCVDNRSTGQGVQCVRCKGSSACTVMSRHPNGNPLKPGKSVLGVLTNSPGKAAQTPGSKNPRSNVLNNGNLLDGNSGLSSQGPSAVGSPGRGAAPAAPAGRIN
jgi:hypothetical protein